MPRWLASLALLLAAAASLSAAPKPPSALDPQRDPRLAQRVRLRSEAIPVRQVVEALKRRTGLDLRVDGAAADERLVAFVPGAAVAEVLESIADLYRLTWQREGEAGYRLVKPLGRAREEQALRERALRGVLARLAARLRDPDLPLDRPSGRPEAWRPVYPALFPIVLARGEELVREGYAYLPIGAIPEGQRQPLVEKLRPLLKAEDDRRTAALEEVRRREIESGIPEDQATLPKPPSDPQQCVLTVDLHVPGPPRASVGLRTDTESWYNWFQIDGEPLLDEAVALYPGRSARVPDAERAGAPDRPGDPLYRPVALPADPLARKGDWIGQLGALSAAGNVSLYADCYTSYEEGYGGHPRGPWVLGGGSTVAQAIDGLCLPRVDAGRWRREPNAFWWRRGESMVLVRSRRWLWEEAAVLPEALTRQLTVSLRTHGKLPGDDLLRIARLGWLQVHGLQASGRSMDAWNLGIRVPARLSPAARSRLTSGTLTWSDLSEPDRRLMAPFLPAPAPEDREPAARLRTELRDVPQQGAVLAVLSYWPMGDPRGRSAYFALPGVDLKLAPRGLEVEALKQPG